jgi:RNA polymerase sigma factor (TIGR02999 family)
MAEVTTLLNALSDSEGANSEDLLSVIYEELRKMAAGKMAGERPNHTLQPTALVNEAFLRLAGSDQNWKNRRHFYASASEAMRRILVESARRRNAAKRGGGEAKLPLNESACCIPADDEKLLQVHEALAALESEEPIKAQVVKMRVFVGLTHREIADLLDLGERTVRRHWEVAKVWLFEEISGDSIREEKP